MSQRSDIVDDVESYTASDVESGLFADPEILTSSLNSVEFAYLARSLCAAAEELGLAVPTFRSPPTAGGAGRSIRRSPGQRATVAVRYRSRPKVSVAADMVEGVLQAGRISASNERSATGDRRNADFSVRDQLWVAAMGALSELEPESGHVDTPTRRSEDRRAA